MLKRSFKFILKWSFLLWLLYIIAVSLYSLSATPRRSHILIIPQNDAIDYNVIFKTITGEYSPSSYDTYVTDVYVSFKAKVPEFYLEVEGKTHPSKNNIVFDSVATKKLQVLFPLIDTGKVYRITNLPVKSLFRFSKNYPFFKTYRVINYSYWEIVKTLFSPLLLFSLTAFFARKKLFVLLITFQAKDSFTLLQKLSFRKVFFDYALLSIIFSVIFLFLEYEYPYYFLQDDSFAQFFPYLSRGLEAFYNKGSLPLYNFLQLNGTADFGYSTYSYLNPVLHVSYWLSFLLGNKFLLLEIFAFLNLLLSALIINSSLTRLGIRQSVRLTAIVSITFSGFVLITGCSWYYILPYLLFISLLLFIAIKIRDVAFSFSSKIALGIGALLGVFIYFGNIQYWTYCMLFFLLLLFSVSFLYHRDKLKKAAFFAVKVFIMSIAVGAPIIILGAIETADTSRAFRPGSSVYPYLWSLFVSFAKGSSLPEQWGSIASYKHHSHFYHIGFAGSVGIILSVIFFSLILIYFKTKRFVSYPIKKDYVWIGSLIVMNILFLMLTIGGPGLIYSLQRFVPFVEKFKLAFKYLPFVVFLSNIIGACFINAFIFSCSQKIRRVYLDVAVYALTALFILLHFKGVNYGFWTYSHAQANIYDERWLRKDEANVSLNKYITISSNRSEESYFTNSLQNNFATAFNLFSVNGYEPLNPKSLHQYKYLHNLDLIRRAGINRIIVWKEPFKINTKYMFLNTSSTSNNNSFNSSDLIFSNEKMSIYKVQGSDPLLFYYQNDQAIKTARFTRHVGASSLIFNLAKPITADSLVINFDYHKRLNAYINDKKIDKRLITKDGYNRIVIKAGDITIIEKVALSYSYFD